jgi:TRAP transporter 4TM/12TM fusion protein
MVNTARGASVERASDIMVAADTGARNPAGWQGGLLLWLPFVWAVFQLYVASDVPYWITSATGFNAIVGNSDTRVLHLAFALTLAAFAFPLLNSSPRNHIPWYDWLLAAAGIASCLYLIVFKDQIARRAGLPTDWDLIASTVGMVTLGIAVYRSLGLPLLCVAGVFVLYVFFGDEAFLPDAIQWKGASYGKAMWHYWMQLEGVFGVAIGVSASMIFLFVLFGGILEKAGAGNYFIKLAFAMLGHLRGGPAKAAVVASGLSGLYSGSSIANVVTTGTFTIPLMKRTGFPAEKAGAIEVAASTNGQLTPPVMGAAAFLIAEFTGVAYLDVVRHAIVPALASYIALLYIVHLEALKMGLKGLPKLTPTMSVAQKLLGFLTGFLGIAALGAVVYYGLGWVKTAFPAMGFYAATAVFLVVYLALLAFAARYPDLTVDVPDKELDTLPAAGATAVTGLYFILPIVVLMWAILIERLSPATAAFWATMSMIFVALTQHPLKALFRGTSDIGSTLRRGWQELFDGMVSGARNMIAIGVATAAAGIIVGTVSLTGAHQVVGEFVEFLSGGNLMLMLILVAVMSLILGMGLPTTANYIVVSSLMAPVIVTVGAQSGLIVPLVAVHLFVFYFGILADDTPPVGLAAFAAAAISGGDPIRTGIQGFMYDIRTAILPFLFIFNTELLLIDVTAAKAVFVFITAVVAMLLFAGATQGYFMAKSRLWESAVLLLVAFTLFRPGYWLDMIDPPYVQSPGAEVAAIIGAAAPGDSLILDIAGTDFDRHDRVARTTILFPVEGAGDGAARLAARGLTVTVEDGLAKLDEPFPGTAYFEKLANQFDFYGDAPVVIETVKVDAERVWKEIFYIPALLLLAGVVMLQLRRATVPPL